MKYAMATQRSNISTGHLNSINQRIPTVAWFMAPGRPVQSPRRHVASVSSALWSVEVVLTNLRRKRFEPKTVERVYEADVYPAVFDFESWHQHRSRGRYLEHCITLFRSYFLRDLLGPLMVLVGASVAVGLYETALQDGMLPTWLLDFGGTSDTPFQLTSFALSLMLVFRTNSSYARWLDARQQWGLIVNTARTFVRQVMTTLPDSSCGEVRSALARWTVAFVRLGKLHLREHGDAKQEVQGLLHGEEVPLVAAASHRPLAACHVMSGLLRSAEGSGQLSEQARMRLEADINLMSQALGACEKILRNPIPLSYTRHTSRFLILWLLWLPLALWGKVGWCVVPVEAVMTYLLLGIDEIAIQMEEPFGILPLENMCEAVQQSVEQLSSMDHTVQDVVTSYACTIISPGASSPSSSNGSEPHGFGSNGSESTVSATSSSSSLAASAATGSVASDLDRQSQKTSPHVRQQQEGASPAVRTAEPWLTPFHMPSDRC
ncbi:hypothetical protein Vretimale_6815 [Volvox reticuliferus]|uniref:Uncharacterized protein n=1 Tax=Volvox reticuliferus TaxID=1737510 RepID=A0A8J4CCP1_9CHLO|nr:hypothetical protein Vretifemale_6997 [Volvox reticuliferus]GIM02103.1 hypothetical protein Vretimale_6815 [Volvox reticuliferus]